MAKITTTLSQSPEGAITPNLQEVTTVGATTNIPIEVDVLLTGTAITGLSENGIGGHFISSTGTALSAYTNNGLPFEARAGVDVTGNIAEFKLTGGGGGTTTVASISTNGIITGSSFIKTGGLSTQFLMADGSTSTGGGGATPTLQEVTTAGATSDKSIIIDVGGTVYTPAISGTGADIGVYGYGSEGYGVRGDSGTVAGVGGFGLIGVYGFSIGGNGLKGSSTSGVGVFGESASGRAGTFGIPTESTSNIVEFIKGDDNQASISHDGKVTANAIVKTGGTSSQFLKADGSIDSNTYLTSDSNYWTKVGNNIVKNNTGSVYFSGDGSDSVPHARYDSTLNSITGSFSNGDFNNNSIGIQQVTDGITMFINNSDGLRGWLQTGRNLTLNTTYSTGFIDFMINSVSKLKLNNNGTLKYATDVSSLYDARTLIDKGYADATYLTSSSNYWTKTGDDIKNNNIGNTQIQIQPTKQAQFLNSAGTQVGFIDENGTYRAGTATQYVTVGLLGGNTWMSMVRLQASMGVILGNPQVNQPFTTTSTNYFGSSYIAGSSEVAAVANAEHSFNIGNAPGDGITSGIFRIGRTRLQSTVPVKYATNLVGSYDNRTLVDKEYVDGLSFSISDKQLLYNDSSTGIIAFDGLSINVDTTKFNVGAIKAWFINNYTDPLNPTKQYRSFPATTANVVPNIATQNVSYLAIDVNGVLQFSASPFDNSLQRDYCVLGVIVHSNRVIINAINNQPVVAIDNGAQLSDLMEAIGFFNISGNVFSPNGANLNINKSFGHVFKQGTNFINTNKDPHTLQLPALVAPTNIRYRLQNGTEYTNTAVVEPGFYDNAGVRIAVPGTKYSIQRIYVFQSNLIRIQYGQAVYSNMAEAIQAITTEPFVVEQNILENGLFRGLLILRDNATDLTDTSKALFIEASKFGSLAGLGSLSTTNLQQAYNNSTVPLIVTNSVLDGFSVKNGTGNADNITPIYKGQNTAGTNTFQVNADGAVTALSFIKSGGTSAQYLMADGSTSAGTGGATPTLQEVTTSGATTNVPTTFATTDPTYSGIRSVTATTDRGAGVYATSTEGTAVYGASSSNGIGVRGVSDSGYGVYGSSVSQIGSYGYTISGIAGIFEQSGSPATTTDIAQFKKGGVIKSAIKTDGKITATAGTSANDVVVKSQLDAVASSIPSTPTLQQVTTAGAITTNPIEVNVTGINDGILASSIDGTAITGTSVNNTGVDGQSTDGNGVTGSTSLGIGVYGESINNIGVMGFSPLNTGVDGTSTDGIGVDGQSVNGIGVNSYSENGVAFSADTGVGNTSDIAEFKNNGIIQASVSHDGNVTSNSFIKSGGTSDEFLKADGSIDSNTYSLTPLVLTLASDFSTTSTTRADVTGMSFDVTAGKKYKITLIGDHQTGVTTTGGSIGFVLTSGTGNIKGFISMSLVATTVASAGDLTISIRAINNVNTTAGSYILSSAVNPINSPHYFTASLIFDCLTTGVFQLQYATEIAASAAQMNAGSVMIVETLN